MELYIEILWDILFDYNLNKFLCNLFLHAWIPSSKYLFKIFPDRIVLYVRGSKEYAQTPITEILFFYVTMKIWYFSELWRTIVSKIGKIIVL